MLVKIVKRYVDMKLKNTVLPESTEEIKIILDVDKKRAKELIDAKVAEKFEPNKVQTPANKNAEKTTKE